MKKPENPSELGPLSLVYNELAADLPFDDALELNTNFILKAFQSLPAEKWDSTYALDKWTVKQLFHHIIDTERVMCFRALNALRGQSTNEIPGMDQDMFANNAFIEKRTPEDLIEEFKVVRAATKYLFKGVAEEQSKQTVLVLGKNTSARALAFIIIGHAVHHVNVLNDTYL